jgi:putative transcriptional regulator
MVVCYNKLWKMLIDKHMKKGEMQALVNISSSTMAKLGKNEFVAMPILVKICNALNCDIGDIMEVVIDK